MPEWIAYCEENREYALKTIRNMPLSMKYQKELSLWVNNYLDPFYICKAVIDRKEGYGDPFNLIRAEAEKDLEFAVLSATRNDRNNSEILLFESNLLLLFNMVLSQIRAA